MQLGNLKKEDASDDDIIFNKELNDYFTLSTLKIVPINLSCFIVS